ncbi:AI-2E family transporter [Lysinibacillus sp. 54212]|uniref:AI-2E family transporter n=1 Tax=Lysinibacillus sp. 54212 TaxID=3119829 RepID=UPI002FC663AE
MKDLIKKNVSLKWLTIFAIIIILFFLKNALNFLLLTFIFTYLGYTLYLKLLNLLPKKLKKPKLLLFVMYSIVLLIIGVTGYRYLPVAIQQFSAIIVQGSSFNIELYEELIPPRIYSFIQNLDLQGILKNFGAKVLGATAGVSAFLLQAFVAILLSFFFILEIDKIKVFTRSFRTPSTAIYYDQLVQFGQSFLNTFGIAIKVQIMISIVNTVLSTAGFVILGFPNIIGLALMVFFLGLMPVIGVVISLVPLSIIAFQVGGTKYLIYMFVMIMVIHALESYFLNPKLYSITMKLPIFYTFIVLMVSEILFGAWGLVIGIPMFVFIVEMIKGSESNSPPNQIK